MNLRLPPPFWRGFAGSSVSDAERFGIRCGSCAAPYWPRAPRNAPVPATIARFRPLWASYWSELLLRSFGSLTFRHRITGIQPRNAPDHGAIIWNGQLTLCKAPSDLLEQGCQRRPLRCQVELLDAGCEEVFSRYFYVSRVAGGPAFPGQ